MGQILCKEIWFFFTKPSRLFLQPLGSSDMPDTWQPSILPPTVELETRAVLKKLPAAHRALAELKGLVAAIPNESILLDTLPLQEAKDSSAIENIITTHDELFNAELNLGDSQAAKEVQRYASALRLGTALVKKYGFLSTNHIAQIQEELKRDSGGYRKLPGTTLKNQFGKVVYMPPQDPAIILDLMANLEQYFNDDSLQDVDPLVKMAVLHFQFESIHPFYDGNGRTGRILNILYLVLKELLDIPVLYLSRFITQNKADYYHQLQAVRDTGNWEPWLLYLLTGIEQTARESIILITEMRALMQQTKHRLRTYKFYSQDLLNNLFRHPYTRIEFLQQELNVSRPTAASYLNKLAEDGVLVKQKQVNSNYYVNQPLFELLARLE
ncbi:MAG TPA: Fic family protein [Hymenobacter sp.]|uniref:Fic family protein n=1 Tax=Hymenobacter sp. TaxID=1898978 RepID=UPI002D80FF4A|nr:Fic family protein [Hymenobacter sp.]HET9505640.1 Fic family protein [Hymenobacter sp.]